MTRLTLPRVGALLVPLLLGSGSCVDDGQIYLFIQRFALVQAQTMCNVDPSSQFSISEATLRAGTKAAPRPPDGMMAPALDGT